jgi:hypothetical protein
MNHARVSVSSLGCTLALAALFPSVAHAQAADMSQKGNLAISNDANLALQGTSTSDNGGSTFTLTLMPAVDYFVIQNLSIGGYVLYQHETLSPGGGGPSTNVDTFGLGPRIGYNVAIGDSFSIWPKAFIGFTSANQSTGNQSGGDQAWEIGVSVPFLFHPAPHFFLGIGPILATQLSNNVSSGNASRSAGQITTYGLAFTLGGWVGL